MGVPHIKKKLDHFSIGTWTSNGFKVAFSGKYPHCLSTNGDSDVEHEQDIGIFTLW